MTSFDVKFDKTISKLPRLDELINIPLGGSTNRNSKMYIILKVIAISKTVFPYHLYIFVYFLFTEIRHIQDGPY